MTKAKPRIDHIDPLAAVAGGEVTIQGASFDGGGLRPQVTFGEAEASLLVASNERLIARIPEESAGSALRVRTAAGESDSVSIEVGVPIADNLHPVANPAVDDEGNVYVTFSGARGQKVPISVYKVDRNYVVKPFASEILNATGLTVGPDGDLFVSNRHDGIVYRVQENGQKQVYAESMGTATGLVFDSEGNLYVGDRSGTIFKVSPERRIFVFATLEPSVAAYHLAMGPDRALYVTGPTTSSYDAVYRITQDGEVSVFYRGLGRPQGLAFNQDGSLFVVASLAGRRGVVQFPPEGKPKLAVSGQNLVGLAFAPGNRLLLATSSVLYHLNWPPAGRNEQSH